MITVGFKIVNADGQHLIKTVLHVSHGFHLWLFKFDPIGINGQEGFKQKIFL